MRGHDLVVWSIEEELGYTKNLQSAASIDRI